MTKGLGLGLLCWGFKGVQKRFRRKTPALFKSGQRHFHQNNAPVHNSTLVSDYLSKMGIKTVLHPAYNPDLAPCDFAYSLSSKAVVMRQLSRWKRLWRRPLTRSHKRVSMGASRSSWNGTRSALQPEEITSKGTRVPCVYYQEKCPSKSLETYLMILIYIYIYIYIYNFLCVFWNKYLISNFSKIINEHIQPEILCVIE